MMDLDLDTLVTLREIADCWEQVLGASLGIIGLALAWRCVRRWSLGIRD
jgi:hypothetical protein